MNTKKAKLSANIALINGLITLLIMFPLGINIGTYMHKSLEVVILFLMISSSLFIILLTTSYQITSSIIDGKDIICNHKGEEKKPTTIFIVVGFWSFIWSGIGVTIDTLLGGIALYVSISTIIAGLIFSSSSSPEKQEKNITFAELEQVIRKSINRPLQGAITWISKQLKTTREKVQQAIQFYYKKNYMEVRKKLSERES